MILSAGLGTRLAPITNELPKPLIPVLLVPQITYSIYQLKIAGITEIAINLHYQFEKIKHYIEGLDVGIEFYFSHETNLLGSAGGVVNIKEWLFSEENCNAVILNGDVVSNFNVKNLIQEHLNHNGELTLGLTPKTCKDYSSIRVGAEKFSNCVIEITPPGKLNDGYLFTGAQVVNQKIFDTFLVGAPADFKKEIYLPLINKKKLTASIDRDCFWFETGDIEKYCSTNFKLLDSLISSDEVGKYLNSFYEWIEYTPIIKDKSLFSPNLDLDLFKKCVYSIIGDCNVLEDEVELKDSIVFRDSLLKMKKYENKIITSKYDLDMKHSPQ